MLFNLSIKGEFKLGIKFWYIQLNYDQINHIPIIYEQNNSNENLSILTQHPFLYQNI